MFKEHEKFWAFVVLVVAIAGLALLGSTLGSLATNSEEANQASQAALLARLRILDGAVVGLIGIAGMAAQSLFKNSSTEENMAAAVGELSKKAPPTTVDPEDVTPGYSPAGEADAPRASPVPLDPWNKP